MRTKIDQKTYNFYVYNPKTKKIITGWEYKSDASDFITENGHAQLKIYTRRFLKQKGTDPTENDNWGVGLLAGTKPYKNKPEMVLYGNFQKDINIPEIKLRYNRGKNFSKINSSKDIYEFLLKVYGRSISIQEQFVLLLTDNSLNILGYYKHTVGTPIATMADIPMLMGIVLKSMARSFIVSHNHPSGKNKPSDPDKELTKTLQKASENLNLKMLDHIIVTKENGYYSFADSGSLSGVSLSGIKKNNNDESLEKRLRQEIFEQLQKVNKNKMLTPNIYNLIQTQNGYAYIEQRIINMVINDRITISASIPQIETEL